MPICANCGAQQPEGAAFCDECGAPLRAQPAPVQPSPTAGQARTVVASNVCPVCGAQTSPQDPFCSNCGAALQEATPGEVETGQMPSQAPPVRPQPSAPSVGATVVSGGMGAALSPPPVGQTPGAPRQGFTCANCGAQLEPDSAFCDMCGAPVRPPQPQAPLPPQVPPQASQPQTPSDSQVWAPPDVGFSEPEPGPTQLASPPEVSPPPVAPSFGTPSAPPPPPVPAGRLVIRGTNASLPFPPGKIEVIVGREDPIRGIHPDVDLTDHGGDEGGVSRRHARITIESGQFYVEDLNSLNHTQINREPLVPGRPHVLQAGDEVSFGRVSAIFQLG